MGRRKRKAVTYRPIRKSPTVFACPNCGQNTMKVEKLKRTEGKGFAIIKCSNCLLEERYDAGPLTDPVDVYAMLVDAFYGEAGDKQDEKREVKAPPAPAPVESTAVATPAPSLQPGQPEVTAVPPISKAVVAKKAKVEEKTSLADLEPKEEEVKITEDDLKEALEEEDDEILDEIKKEGKDEKLPFPEDVKDEDEDEDDEFK
nr:hypothetical protein [Candidatus Sigynarchaeota archaeon]